MIKFTQGGSPVFTAAVKYSIPVMLGYLALGSAFGLLIVDTGYPWWLSPVMSFVMFAGAGQFIAVGLFAAGANFWEAVLVQLVVNARHIAYGFSMFNRYNETGLYKYYLAFGMTDETFALLSSMPENTAGSRKNFMLIVTAMNHLYWVVGSTIGAIAGSLIPFNTEGVGFALVALFVVLMIEQILKIRKPGIFVVSAICAVFGVIFLPSRMALLAAMILALLLAYCLQQKQEAAK